MWSPPARKRGLVPAHKLAQKLAQRTGETLTRAVTEALRERLDRVNRAHAPETTANDLLAIGRRCAATLKRRPVDHAALLYDEHGLPK
jgi:antitoxin VapB